MAFKKAIPNMLPTASASEKGIQNLISAGGAATASTNGTAGTQILAADNIAINNRTLAVTPASMQSIIARAQYATCSTATNTVAKVAILPNFVLNVGAIVAVSFSYGNRASSPTLNINSTGSYPIRYGPEYLYSFDGRIKPYVVYLFVFDGNNWQLMNPTTETTVTSNITYYIEKTGDDNNTGLSQVQALKTWNRFREILKTLRVKSTISVTTLTIQFGAGTFTDEILYIIGQEFSGKGFYSVYIKGVNSTTSGTIFRSSTSNAPISIQGAMPFLYIENCRIECTQNSYGIFIYNNPGIVNLNNLYITSPTIGLQITGHSLNTITNNVEFGPCERCIYIDGGKLSLSNITMSTMNYFVVSYNNVEVYFNNLFTFKDNPTFTSFVSIARRGSMIFASSFSHTGEHSGKKYNLITGSSIAYSIADETLLPGTTPGTLDATTYCWVKKA